ncbi:hypothetical protein GF312_07475 [Candidatus Poribacteria bacterium]|nr:hypothetical protein [Candidatus Poribacteria bacterium]
MRRRESKISGGKTRVTYNYKDGTSTDIDLNRIRTKVDTVVDHDKDGSSHEHKAINSIFGWSKGDRKK